MRTCLAVAAVLSVAANVEATELVLRMGEGGFRDDRAPDGTLGGDQLCLDLKLDSLPLAFSVGGELYTKGPPATGVYEIENLYMASVFYVRPLAEKWPTHLYLGAGIGLLQIPQGDTAAAIQAVARIDTKIFWRMGVYAEGKYLHSRQGLIDFDAAVLLVGISFKWAW